MPLNRIIVLPILHIVENPPDLTTQTYINQDIALLYICHVSSVSYLVKNPNRVISAMTGAQETGRPLQKIVNGTGVSMSLCTFGSKSASSKRNNKTTSRKTSQHIYE